MSRINRPLLLTSLAVCLLGIMPALATDNGSEVNRGREQLARFLGTWHGESQDGTFEERTQYRWGPGQTHLIVNMQFFVDDELTGEGSGFMAWDADNDHLVFDMVSSHGTMIRQTQIGGSLERMELAAETINGTATGFPAAFRTHIEFTGNDSYESGVWLPNGTGDWQQVMHNMFRRVSTD